MTLSRAEAKAIGEAINKPSSTIYRWRIANPELFEAVRQYTKRKQEEASMPTETIIHDAEQFAGTIATLTYKQKVLMYVDVINRDGRPGELLAVVRDYSHNGNWYSNGKVYSTYRHAFAAIGAAIDRCNPDHNPLDDQWSE